MDFQHFKFYDPGKLVDRDLELILVKKALPFDEIEVHTAVPSLK